jgi:S1-C subfamily serine protease
VVRVTAAPVGKSFAKAGLQAADVIRAVDDTSVDSVEGFRQLLRRGLAWEEGVLLRVFRAGKTQDVWVDIPW